MKKDDVTRLRAVNADYFTLGFANTANTSKEVWYKIGKGNMDSKDYGSP